MSFINKKHLHQTCVGPILILIVLILSPLSCMLHPRADISAAKHKIGDTVYLKNEQGPYIVDRITSGEKDIIYIIIAADSFGHMQSYRVRESSIAEKQITHTP